MQQKIQYCTTPDGVRLAYSMIGKGTSIVRTPHWFAHLEYDLQGPIFRHQILVLAHRHSVLRYDGRGIGLSQRDISEISFDRLVADLETVVAGLERLAPQILAVEESCQAPLLAGVDFDRATRPQVFPTAERDLRVHAVPRECPRVAR
jgi:pimeloyl-ACP methyl ester carboxylesterase